MIRERRDPFETVTAADLQRIERFFQERGALVFHEVSPLADATLLALLNDRGYQPVEFTSVMFRPIERGLVPAASRNQRIQVRLAREDEQALCTEVTARGWGHLPELAGFVREMGRLVARRLDAHSFVAELDGRPIASGVLCLGDGVALLAGACTVPEARQRGAQQALLEGRLRYAAEQGCDIAMICAQPGSASQRNAQRHGFRIAYTRIKWGLKSQGAQSPP